MQKFWDVNIAQEILLKFYKISTNFWYDKRGEMGFCFSNILQSPMQNIRRSTYFQTFYNPFTKLYSFTIKIIKY